MIVEIKPVFIGRIGLDTSVEDYLDLYEYFIEELEQYKVIFVYNDSNKTEFEIVK